MATERRPALAGLPDGLRRSQRDRVLGGVCGGIARYVGVDPVVVRLAAVVLTFVSGFGIALYAVAWIVIPEARQGEEPRPTATPGRGREHAVAVGFITVGALLLLRSLGLWFPDHLVWPFAIAAIGLAFVWARTDPDTRGDRVEAALSGATPVRVLIGAVLLLVGFGTFFATNDSFATLGAIGVAVVATALGAAVLFGPWIVRLWRELSLERRERIRQEERAEVAAHLHDSVLQTLALIQRRSGSPQEMTRLARRQERELRAWLYGERDRDQVETLASALETIADDVEEDHAVTVEVVTAGDCPLDTALRAVVDATREAVVNAAKHAGVDEVAVFAEVETDHVAVYVRDRGKGFDPAAVDGDRRGIADSIIGRMQRHGGAAAVLSEPGNGTEVVVEVKR